MTNNLTGATGIADAISTLQSSMKTLNNIKMPQMPDFNSILEAKTVHYLPLTAKPFLDAVDIKYEKQGKILLKAELSSNMYSDICLFLRGI